MADISQTRLLIQRHGRKIMALALLVAGVVVGGGAMRLWHAVRAAEPVITGTRACLATEPCRATTASVMPVNQGRNGSATLPSATTTQPGLDLVVVTSRPVKNDTASVSSKKQWSEESEFGITARDVQHIASCFDNISQIAMVRDLRRSILGRDGTAEVKLFAVMPSFLEATRGKLKDNRGRWFSPVDMTTKKHVCVLGTQAAARLFGLRDPLGKEVIISDVGFTVVGIIENSQGVKIGDVLISDSALIPLETANAAFGSRLAAAANPRWRKVYARVACDYLFIRVATARQVENTVTRLRSYFQATHEKPDYEIHVLQGGDDRG